MNSNNSTPYSSNRKEKVIKQSWRNVATCIFLILTANVVVGEDSLSALMQAMKSDQAVKIAYQETRSLALLDQPWQGSGYLYSMPPDIMIKEQLKPERILMGVSGENLLYFDPGNQVRHQSIMDEDNPMSLNVAVFKALMNADQQLLNSMYRVEFFSTPEQWIMTLKARKDPESAFRIDILGLPGQQVNTIKVQQADGDSSELILKKAGEGNEIKTIVSRLYQELLGE